MDNYSRDLRLAKWGSEVRLHRSIPEPLMSALGQKRTSQCVCAMSALPPCVDGSELARRIFTLQVWSVHPCVRPVCAVHMTAGHNALRGSGPGQKAAFEDAVAQVGCPDRRIDGSALRHGR